MPSDKKDERDSSRHKERRDKKRRERSRSRSRGRDGDRESKRKEKKSRRHYEDDHESESKKSESNKQSGLTSNYTELDNPFNDINLGEQFTWHKKVNKERKRGVSPTSARRQEAIRRREAEEELAALNRRRIDREEERVLREEEESRMRNLADSAQMAEWLSKEGDFQLEQERTRAAIRIKERRAKAVDFLAQNLRYASPNTGKDPSWDSMEDDGAEIDLDEPYIIVENLSLDQSQELREDIQRYLALEKEAINIEFWTNMILVCEDYISKLSALKSGGSRGADVSSAVQTEIASLLTGKTFDELAELQGHVQAKLTGGEAVDVDYWESLLKSLVVWKAKAKLKMIHEVVVRNRLEHLRRRQRDEALQAQQQLAAVVKPELPSETESKTEPKAEIRRIPYLQCMSPRLEPIVKLSRDDMQLEVIPEDVDLKNIAELRRTVARSRFIVKPAATPGSRTANAVAPEQMADNLWQAEAERNLDEEEEIFNQEAKITKATPYTWEDKYRPRKPKYFNRVQTGYEWNKYNQTHYDIDNPPPKVVQGYKFNIFYPDLIDKTKAPTYKIVKEAGNSDTVLLYFTSGPPYEDIAFRIVDREWEYSHKRGFRSSFDHGTLSLWFNFRRSYYRK